MAAPHSPEPLAARLPLLAGELGAAGWLAAGVEPLPQAATPAALAAASAAAPAAVETRRATRRLLPGDVRLRDTGMFLLRFPAMGTYRSSP